jgi:aryl-alcohol dehydrogenase-like predicted oxidoreductase
MLGVKIDVLPFSISRFIFGTAQLFNAGSGIRRRDILFAAVDSGFTHFDTAPYYGFGLAERDLSAVLKAHPHVTFTTKVGIYSPGGENQTDASVFIRKAVGRFIKPVARPAIDFSLARARTALEGSLRRLGRDAIDIYTLHEPELALVQTDEWLKWLDACVQQGKVRCFGLALTADKLEPFLSSNSPLAQYVQVPDSLKGREADVLIRYGKPLQVTYSYVSAARQDDSTMSVSDILKQALQRNAHGAIIVSTTKVGRLPQYAKLADEARNAQ